MGRQGRCSHAHTHRCPRRRLPHQPPPTHQPPHTPHRALPSPAMSSGPIMMALSDRSSGWASLRSSVVTRICILTSTASRQAGGQAGRQAGIHRQLQAGGQAGHRQVSRQAGGQAACTAAQRGRVARERQRGGGRLAGRSSRQPPRGAAHPRRRHPRCCPGSSSWRPPRSAGAGLQRSMAWQRSEGCAAWGAIFSAGAAGTQPFGCSRIPDGKWAAIPGGCRLLPGPARA